ncbi:queuosine precursor transporter [Methanimicrococcus hongohii]|uniref:Probable queuosine precursor transporter n=1 Tax=Methanimicrococcus hongohii TaxID=3028295 RepID=A0AA97A2L2_9EURY|nr:queuosine precursor transporter [Methanimicrococcus sp. Hf6]WNY24188.1 queuosine precursor transporter [Methanimicrococcus sp. Hf6]
MNYDLLFVLVFWIIAMTIVTLSSVQIVKKYPAYGFAALTAFYVAYLLCSQVIATKMVTFDLGTWWGYAIILSTPGAAILYPFIAQVLDMINEVYGKKRAMGAIAIALATQVLYVMFIAMALKTPAASFYELDAAWASIFALSIGVTFASWISFLICSILDTYMFSYIKNKLRPRELAFKGDAFFNPYIWIRSLTTDAVSLAIDSVLFVVIAFYIFGGMSWEVVTGLIIGQLVVKVVVGIADTPWFVLYKRMLGKTDLSDVKFVEEKV